MLCFDRLGRGREGIHCTVLCTVYCVLCTVYCVLCTVYCVLCTVYWLASSSLVDEEHNDVESQGDAPGLQGL